MSMSYTIAEFANAHPIFGAQEIREAHGHKAALLVTRLAAKHQYIRLANGVFALPGLDMTSAHYQDYLERRHEAMLLRADQPDASITDQLLAWASNRHTFSVLEASKHFNRDIKGWLRALLKGGRIEHTGHAAYRYAGYIPAQRRTNIPMAEAFSAEHDTVLNAIKGNVATASDLGTKTGIDTNRLTNILNRLVADGKITRSIPSSSSLPHYYSIVRSLPKTLTLNEITLLAIIGTQASLRTDQALHHGISDPRGTIQSLLARGLIQQDEKARSSDTARYSATPIGHDKLAEENYGTANTDARLHRTLAREMLKFLSNRPTATRADLEELCKASSWQDFNNALHDVCITRGVEADLTRRMTRFAITNIGRAALNQPAKAVQESQTPDGSSIGNAIT